MAAVRAIIGFHFEFPMAKGIPLKNGLPERFVDRLEQQFPKHAEDIMQHCEQRPPIIRVNTTLTTLQDVQKTLKAEGMESKKLPELDKTLHITEGTRKQLTATEIYKQGHFYIQSFASQFIVYLMDPQPGETILDLCAAPGSKTTQIAVAMNAEGELMANDNNRQRMFRLIANLKHQHLDEFVEVKNYAGQNYDKFYPEHFDRILVDAPCSSESRFQRRYPKSINFWSRHKVKACAKLQRRLLTAAIRSAKPGAVIMYSTCTFAPEENELVLHRVMKKNPNIKILPIETKYERLPIVKEWNGEEIHPDVQNALRLKPSELCEGFFMAKLQKIAS